jgi:hypothetical protein
MKIIAKKIPQADRANDPLNMLWPAIVFLHRGSAKTGDLKRVEIYGVRKILPV